MTDSLASVSATPIVKSLTREQEEEPEQKRSILHQKLVQITLFITYIGLSTEYQLSLVFFVYFILPSSVLILVLLYLSCLLQYCNVSCRLSYFTDSFVFRCVFITVCTY